MVSWRKVFLHKQKGEKQMSAKTLFLKKAQDSVQSCPTADTRIKRVELRKLQLELARTELGSVLPIEGEAREVIQQRIELLERTIEDPTFEERYPFLSMEVLRWRDQQGFPKLALFSLTDPAFSIEADYNWWFGQADQHWQVGGSIQQLPKPISSLYGDILERFKDEFQKDMRKNPNLRTGKWCKNIRSRFSGVIPQWVRKKIQQATADFSVSTQRVEINNANAVWPFKRKVMKTDIATNIFLIAEVDKWVVNKETLVVKEASPLPDPLVVGYKAGCLWFICSFDETPLENYVRMEFTS